MKQKRQLRIIELVNHNVIETQEDLALRLRKEGFAVTQATVSRDIRELNLSKVPAGNGRQKYTFVSGTGNPSADKYVRILHDGLISMENACSKPPKTNSSGYLITSKSDTFRHGYGLKSISRIVNRYQGSMNTQYESEKRIFRTMILLTDDSMAKDDRKKGKR